MRLRPIVCAALLLCLSAQAQEKGQWRAASTTARGVTGDVAFTDIKIAINFSAFTIAQIRTLDPAEATALFHAEEGSTGTGNLFRTEIPGDKRFLHKNTLCGADEVQWVASFVSGKTLQLAFFSGASMPKLTPDDLANATNLCGTYTYVR